MSLVWVSRAMVHASNQRPFRNDVAERDHDGLIEIKQRNERGEVLAPDEFPKVIFGAPHAEEKDYCVPDLFAAYGYWVLSEAAANVLRESDLGQAQLVPVPVLKSDRKTPVGGTWFCVNFANARRLLVPEQSDHIRMGPQQRYNLPATTKDNQVVVSADALQPPDIWVDPEFWAAFFVSERLGTALRRAKVDKSFFLTKCQVLGA